MELPAGSACYLNILVINISQTYKVMLFHCSKNKAVQLSYFPKVGIKEN